MITSEEKKGALRLGQLPLSSGCIYYIYYATIGMRGDTPHGKNREILRKIRKRSK